MAAEMVIHIDDCDVIIVEEKIGTVRDDCQDVFVVEEKMGTDIDDSQIQDVIIVEEKMCNPL